MTDLEVELAAYLDTVASRRFAFGALDCCTLMADWLMRRGFADPMADRRGTYATYRQYRRAIRAEGGTVQSCSRRFAAIGLSQTARPAAGDVCLVAAPVARRNGRLLWGATGAIRVDDRVCAIVAAGSGLIAAPMRVLRAWSSNNG